MKKLEAVGKKCEELEREAKTANQKAVISIAGLFFSEMAIYEETFSGAAPYIRGIIATLNEQLHGSRS